MVAESGQDIEYLFFAFPLAGQSFIENLQAVGILDFKLLLYSRL